jgi:hypothetical protein
MDRIKISDSVSEVNLFMAISFQLLNQQESGQKAGPQASRQPREIIDR